MISDMQKLMRDSTAASPAPLPGDFTSSGAFVAMDVDVDASLIAAVPEELTETALTVGQPMAFCQKYAELLENMDSVKDQDTLALTEDESSALTNFASEIQAEPITQDLMQRGHAEAAGPLQRDATVLGFASSFRWQPPTPSAVQVGFCFCFVFVG